MANLKHPELMFWFLKKARRKSWVTIKKPINQPLTQDLPYAPLKGQWQQAAIRRRQDGAATFKLCILTVITLRLTNVQSSGEINVV